jgi:hypothetical protein
MIMVKKIGVRKLILTPEKRGDWIGKECCKRFLGIFKNYPNSFVKTFLARLEIGFLKKIGFL